MTREIKSDFIELETFINEFNLSQISNNDKLLAKLKPMHKKLFAMMTFIAEIEQKNESKKILSTECVFYLKESVSDLGQSIFCWILGAYKPANLTKGYISL